MLPHFFALLLYIIVAESAKDKYEYIPSVERYIKLHRIPANWHEARLRCHLEGGILASPESKNMISAIIKIMQERKVGRVYTGIHATYSKGDYTTITGTPLSELDVEWQHGEPDNVDNNEDCLTIDSSEKLADDKCTNDYPFICHKTQDKKIVHSCSHSHSQDQSDYVLYNETGSCYKFHREGCSWSVAFRTCQAEDAYLAIINSEEESKLMKELFAKNLPNAIPGDFHKDAASIGFTKLDENQEWFTIHGQSLTEAGFAAFNVGGLNDIGNKGKCGSVWRTGLLNDHNCDRYLTFICEKPMASA